MEKHRFKPYDREHMRMAMLRHEATFKEQVNDLHRLYQVQKILMKNIRSSNSNSQRKVQYSEQRPISAVDYDDDIINKIIIRDKSDGGGGGDIDESDIELTLGPTSYGRRRRREANKPDCGPSFSSSSTESSSHLNRTQTAGNNNNNNSKKVENVEEELRLNKHPPWLFQVLSLNMT